MGGKRENRSDANGDQCSPKRGECLPIQPHGSEINRADAGMAASVLLVAAVVKQRTPTMHEQERREFSSRLWKRQLSQDGEDDREA